MLSYANMESSSHLLTGLVIGPCVQVVPGKADKKPDSHEHALQAYSNGKEVPYR
jgi:hypothetical protein